LHTDQKHKFIAINDDNARIINDRANHLYEKLLRLDISDTEIDDFGKHYFSSHHAGRRLFFSIQSSADIIYQSVKKSNKAISEISFIDYGAGLGTLFLLAGLTGFKKVYFNDYFPQWAVYAKIICDKLDIKIDDFISGDIDAVIKYCKERNTHIDIIASRNVVEHIYSLRSFYTKLFQSGITTICYATTTANYHNPAMRLKHYWYHNKVEKATYRNQREEKIKGLVPDIDKAALKNLVKYTRGKAFDDFTYTIECYFKNQPIPSVEFLSTNTCDCENGVWAENLITKQNYFDIIRGSGFAATYTAGFWDTNYKNSAVNLFTRFLNWVIKASGKNGIWFAPFVNVVACKQ
jgi:hypothetical protein